MIGGDVAGFEPSVDVAVGEARGLVPPTTVTGRTVATTMLRRRRPPRPLRRRSRPRRSRVGPLGAIDDQHGGAGAVRRRARRRWSPRGAAGSSPARRPPRRRPRSAPAAGRRGCRQVDERAQCMDRTSLGAAAPRRTACRGKAERAHRTQGVSHGRRVASTTMAPSEQVTIFHNPKCSTSNHAMATADELGVAHDTVLYLKTPPDEATLRGIIAKLEDPVTDLVRRDADLGQARPHRRRRGRPRIRWSRCSSPTRSCCSARSSSRATGRSSAARRTACASCSRG